MNEGVSNQFDYVPVRTLNPFIIGYPACTAIGLGIARARTSRVVIVRVGGRYIMCRTDTASFSEAEIRDFVHACGQLYMDVSRRAAITDFENDLRQLTISSKCRSCDYLESCCACYEPAAEQFFIKDERWLRERIASARGSVLDVGIGELPYIDAIEELIRAGTVEYNGLDTDIRALEVIRGKGLPIQLFHCGIETFSSSKRYDMIVAIRSLNHFDDADMALARMSSYLAPGGRLLLVESLPLPLVRSRQHAELCHTVAFGGYQHKRNWSSHRVIEAVANLPLRLVFHRPVGRDTCNQWILELERI